MFFIAPGTADVTIYVRLRDSTTGLAKTGLAYNSAGILIYYTRPLAAATAITPATQTVTGAHSDGGFVEVDATNAKGLYRLDLPDAVCASSPAMPYVVVTVQFTGVISEAVAIVLGGAIGSVIGAVGSVTGNVGGNVAGSVASVTGAVGSVTGNVGGNVVGSVASVTGAINTAAGVITTLDALDTAQDTQHGTTQTAVGTVDTVVDAILADTGADGVIVASIATDAVNAAALAADAVAEINATVDTALADYDGPTNAEMVARTLAAAAYFDPTSDAVANVTLVGTTTNNTDMRGTDNAATAAALATVALYIDTEVASILAAVDTEVASIKAVTDAIPNGGALTALLASIASILAGTSTDGVVISQATRQAIADELLARSVANVEDTAGVYSLAAIVLAAFESAIAGTTWTINKTDGATPFATRTVTTDAAADPITGVE